MIFFSFLFFSFFNVGSDLASKIHNTGKHYYDYITSAHNKSIFIKPITEDEIVKIMCKFDKNKSALHDGVGNLIVTRVANEIACPLSAIFNLSLTTGIFPDQLKIAKVIHIYKKTTIKISNYRPVFVLPCFSKIVYLKDWSSTQVMIGLGISELFFCKSGLKQLVSKTKFGVEYESVIIFDLR